MRPEQHGCRGQPLPFPVVVGGDERDRPVACADAADDRGEHLPELRRDLQQALGVGLGRGDLQQRDKLAGAGQPVLHQAASQPPVLPRVSRLVGEPVQQQPQPEPVLTPGLRRGRGERRSRQPLPGGIAVLRRGGPGRPGGPSWPLAAR
ncbi:MAG TPA: hypothetical protein VGG54_23220 [Trebonia sp.]